MYYIVVTQKFGDIRNTITIAGKNKFTDLFDDNKLMDPRYVMIKDKAFKEIIADGFSTEEDCVKESADVLGYALHPKPSPTRGRWHAKRGG